MSEYKDWLEQHRDNCDTCQINLKDPSKVLEQLEHMDTLLSPLDTGLKIN